MLPKEFSVALVDRFQTNTSAVSDLQYSFGLLEYLNRVPTYLSELYTIYRYSRVTWVDFEVTLVNTGSAPIDLIVGVIPQVDTTAVTPAILEQKPGSVRKLVSIAGGMDRVTIRKSCDPAEWLGNPYQTKDYWVTATQAASTTPLDVNEPVFLVIPSQPTTAMSYVLNVRTTYHVQLFDIRTATNQ